MADVLVKQVLLAPGSGDLVRIDIVIVVGVQTFEKLCDPGKFLGDVVARGRGAIAIRRTPLGWTAAEVSTPPLVSTSGISTSPLVSTPALISAASLESPATGVSTAPIASAAAAAALRESNLGNAQNCNYNRYFEGR
jgi:hypothetical protein